MKRALLALLVMGLFVAFEGCAHHGCGLFGSCQMAPENCNGCHSGVCGHCHQPHAKCRCGNAARGDGGEQAVAGPTAAQVSYPYYTIRGPRDFLARSPKPIGP